MLRLTLILALSQVILASTVPESFVVGGQDAVRGQFPYLASFRYPQLGLIHGCAGNILNTRWLLTAAHCIDPGEIQNFVIEIRVGINELSDSSGAVYISEEIVMHPGWGSSRTSLRNRFFPDDIGLVRSSTSIIFNAFVQPVTINRNFVSRTSQAIAAGFGATSMFPIDPVNPVFPEMSETLQWIRLNVITNTNCNARISLTLLEGEFSPYALRDQMCTYNRLGESVCFGDSGSGLLLNNQLIGIVARGIVLSNQECARGFPDIHTRVSQYINWIDSYITRI